MKQSKSVASCILKQSQYQYAIDWAITSDAMLVH